MEIKYSVFKYGFYMNVGYGFYNVGFREWNMKRRNKVKEVKVNLLDGDFLESKCCIYFMYRIVFV